MSTAVVAKREAPPGPTWPCRARRSAVGLMATSRTGTTPPGVSVQPSCRAMAVFSAFPDSSLSRRPPHLPSPNQLPAGADSDESAGAEAHGASLDHTTVLMLLRSWITSGRTPRAEQPRLRYPVLKPRARLDRHAAPCRGRGPGQHSTGLAPIQQAPLMQPPGS